MTINDKKICFIMCSNDIQYTNECLRYISNLNIPDGYEIDALTITEAQSMTSGYNEGMNATDAKYKVYLHQDVFIINKKLIQDILSIFENQEIGMIGIVGSITLPKTGIMWHGSRVGKLYSNNVYRSYISDFEKTDDRYCEVEAVDGLMMITQVDLPWREDIFTGWDFYDVSECMEFRKKGYKIVVPNCPTPWCLHDDGMINRKRYIK